MEPTGAWRTHGSFDPARGAPAGWLLAIVADRARRARVRPRPTTGWLPTVSAADRTPDVDLAAALETLALRQRLAVELHYYLDLPVTEVAAAMGCAEGTVKATLLP